ncbi:MAG TPA: M28 family peptidase [Allosphingosinicella sp.]
MILRFLCFFAFLLPAVAAPAQTVTADALRRHIEVLASDAFEGRGPGTEGEKKTIAYISERMRSYGLEPAAGNGSWYQPVGVVTRLARGQSASFKPKRGKALSLGQGALMLIGRTGSEGVAGAPVWFAGHGTAEQLGNADLRGAAVLILYESADKPNFPAFRERAEVLTKRGAAAVIAIYRKSIPWEAIRHAYQEGQTRLAGDPVAAIQGALSEEGAGRLARAAGTDFLTLVGRPYRDGFTAMRLPFTVSLSAASEVRPIETHNVLGRIRGSGNTVESVLYLGHWDHLGICAPEGAADRICNGAVDNASGIAVLLEVARGLAAGPKPKRDILFLATTAEEMGLLGATHFAAHPTVPLTSIVAAMNLDTVAISPKGEKVAVIGGGMPALDAVLAQTISAMGRVRDTDKEADPFITRQDGWALTRAGVPAIMVGGSFSDMKALEGFLSGPYHKPEDDLSRPLVLEGAAEDADLHIALGRKLADPAAYPTPAAGARP